MKKILVPTDFMESSVNALNYAAILSQHLNAKVYLLHVYQVPVPATDIPISYPVPTDDFEKGLMEESQRLIRDQKQKLGWNAEVKFITRAGITTTEINETVEELEIDLIVMGLTHNITLTDRIFGSTGTWMIKKTKVPVLFIPETVTFQVPDRIGIAVDFNHVDDLNKQGIIREFAELFKSKLDIFSVISPDEDSPSDRAVIFSGIENAVKDLNHSIHITAHKNVTENILSLVEENQSRILGIFHHHPTLFERIFSTFHSREVSYEVKIPLLVIPE